MDQTDLTVCKMSNQFSSLMSLLRKNTWHNFSYLSKDLFSFYLLMAFIVKKTFVGFTKINLLTKILVIPVISQRGRATPKSFYDFSFQHRTPAWKVSLELIVFHIEFGGLLLLLLDVYYPFCLFLLTLTCISFFFHLSLSRLCFRPAYYFVNTIGTPLVLRYISIGDSIHILFAQAVSLLNCSN